MLNVRLDKERGGGVGILHRSSIKLKVLKSSSDDIYKQFEFTDCSLLVNGRNLHLCLVYRPPTSSSALFLEEWEEFMNKLVSMLYW